MFRKLVVVSSVVLLTACSSFDKRIEGPDSVTSEFMGGEVKITFNKDGKFKSMVATGSARMVSNLPSAQEEAFIIAQMRAKQKLTEFLQNEIDTDNTTSIMSESLQDGQNVAGSDQNQLNAKISRSVQEQIKSSAKTILKGVHVESKKVDTKTNIILVTVGTSEKNIAVAKQVRSMMGN